MSDETFECALCEQTRPVDEREFSGYYFRYEKDPDKTSEHEGEICSYCFDGDGWAVCDRCGVAVRDSVSLDDDIERAEVEGGDAPVYCLDCEEVLTDSA